MNTNGHEWLTKRNLNPAIGIAETTYSDGWERDDPITIAAFDSGECCCPGLRRLPNGDLVVGVGLGGEIHFADNDGDHAAWFRSRDHGVTWAPNSSGTIRPSMPVGSTGRNRDRHPRTAVLGPPYPDPSAIAPRDSGLGKLSMSSFAQGLGKRSEDVLLTLRRELEGGDYALGQYLQPEEQLAERFAVSRNTVRRAVSRLVAEGYLERRHGVGLLVIPRAMAPVASRMVAAMVAFETQNVTALQNHALAENYLLCVFFRQNLKGDLTLERAFLERARAERVKFLLASCAPRPPYRNANDVKDRICYRHGVSNLARRCVRSERIDSHV